MNKMEIIGVCLVMYLHVRHVVSVVKTDQILPFQHLVYLLLATFWEMQQEGAEEYEPVSEL